MNRTTAAHPCNTPGRMQAMKSHGDVTTPSSHSSSSSSGRLRQDGASCLPDPYNATTHLRREVQEVVPALQLVEEITELHCPFKPLAEPLPRTSPELHFHVCVACLSRERPGGREGHEMQAGSSWGLLVPITLAPRPRVCVHLRGRLDTDLEGWRQGRPASRDTLLFCSGHRDVWPLSPATYCCRHPHAGSVAKPSTGRKAGSRGPGPRSQPLVLLGGRAQERFENPSARPREYGRSTSP